MTSATLFFIASGVGSYLLFTYALRLRQAPPYFEEMVCDGWAERRVKGFKLRRNPRHIERVREAIRIRLDRETEFWVAP